MVEANKPVATTFLGIPVSRGLTGDFDLGLEDARTVAGNYLCISKAVLAIVSFECDTRETFGKRKLISSELERIDRVVGCTDSKKIRLDGRAIRRVSVGVNME